MLQLTPSGYGVSEWGSGDWRLGQLHVPINLYMYYSYKFYIT